ncbi:hypothetical protein AB0B46_18295, partial [Streptomyces diastaticus]
IHGRVPTPHERPNHHIGHARPAHLNKIVLRALRALDRLKEFSAHLEPRKSVPAVREFRERLQALPVAA